MMHVQTQQSQILEKFAGVVAKSLRIDPSLVTSEAYLDDLGAESLDLIEITMETESQFNVFLPDRSILETAVDVFGPGVLEKDGFLTDKGKQLMLRRMPEMDAGAFQGEVAVKDLRRYFLKVSTWVRMIEGLLAHTPQVCAACGGALAQSMGFRLKCGSCGQEITLRSGEEINREWAEAFKRESGDTGPMSKAVGSMA